jgi:ribosome-binding factor A
MAVRPSSKGPSQRQLRVGELVRHALAEILSRGDVQDEALAGTIVTVPEVAMSADLRLATCYVVPLGGENSQAIVAALERNKRFLRGEVAHRIDLRYAPDLRFRLDDSFDRGAHIDALLRSPEVSRDTGAAPDAAGETDDE